jgi:hypothetical protein
MSIKLGIKKRQKSNTSRILLKMLPSLQLTANTLHSEGHYLSDYHAV